MDPLERVRGSSPSRAAPARSTFAGAVRWWRRTVAASTVAAGAASLYWAFAPVYASTTTGVGAGGVPGAPPVPGPSGGGGTLAEVNGPGVYLVLLVPVLLAALPLLARRPGVRLAASALSALLLSAFTVLGGFSIGLPYAAAAALAWVAAVLAGAALVAGGRGGPQGSPTGVGGEGGAAPVRPG